MKKSELKTEIRNRILEKKKSIDEVNTSDVNLSKVNDTDIKNALQNDKSAGIDSQIKAALNAFEDIIDFMEISDFTRLKNDVLQFLTSKEKALKTKSAEAEKEEKEGEDDEEVNEMSTSNGAGSYLTKYAFKLPKDYKKVSEGVIEPKQKKKA